MRKRKEMVKAEVCAHADQPGKLSAAHKLIKFIFLQNQKTFSCTISSEAAETCGTRCTHLLSGEVSQEESSWKSYSQKATPLTLKQVPLPNKIGKSSNWGPENWHYVLCMMGHNLKYLAAISGQLFTDGLESNAHKKAESTRTIK